MTQIPPVPRKRGPCGRSVDCRGTRWLATGLSAGTPLVCGILNVTPDSFSDGGLFDNPRQALVHGQRVVDEGADLIDIGGESTRPGSRPPTVQEELARVIPVIAALSQHVQVPLSVDTSRPEVMRAAVAEGASMINDVRALRRPGALDAVAELGVPVCLMHMQHSPDTMQFQPHYHDVVREVHDFLGERLKPPDEAGIRPDNLLVDPVSGSESLSRTTWPCWPGWPT